MPPSPDDLRAFAARARSAADAIASAAHPTTPEARWSANEAIAALHPPSHQARRDDFAHHVALRTLLRGYDERRR